MHRLITLNGRLNLGGLSLPGFKRRLSAVKRCLLFAFLVSSAPLVHAAPLDLGARDNALGSATAFGHARIVRPLGDLQIGELTYPLTLVFKTNPADAPGAFGPYWRLPLFASTVVQFNQYKLYWDGPDERRQFFVLDRSEEGRRGEQVFIERGKDWKATVGRRGEILVESLEDADWNFRYVDGRLEEFRLGTSSDPCRITWSGRGLPLYITNQATNRRIFEIQYRGATDPERILIGDRPIAVEMGDGELTAPDGVSNYRNYRVSFLRSLTLAEDEAEHFTYSKADTRQRKVSLVDAAKQAVSKTLDLAVNRMEIADTASGGSAGNWIEWEAKSGFVTADSGASYDIANKSWDPNVQDGSLDVTPTSVEIIRQPLEGSEERWAYHWSSGVRVYTDLATGEVIRRTIIMSEGPANGKLRKREVLKDGKWTPAQRNSYDPSGRLIRSVQGDSVRIWEWVDTRDGSEAIEYLNGGLVRRTIYDAVGELKEREIFKANGDVDRFVYTNTEIGMSYTYYLNDQFGYYRERDKFGLTKYVRWSDGKETFRFNQDGNELVLRIFEDGRSQLIERRSAGVGYSVVDSRQRIVSAIDHVKSLNIESRKVGITN